MEGDIDGFLIWNLLYWLKRSSRIKLPIVKTSMDFNNKDSFVEILINIFSRLTLDVVYNNPYNSYEEIEQELTYLKGRLNIDAFKCN